MFIVEVVMKTLKPQFSANVATCNSNTSPQPLSSSNSSVVDATAENSSVPLPLVENEGSDFFQKVSACDLAQEVSILTKTNY